MNDNNKGDKNKQKISTKFEYTIEIKLVLIQARLLCLDAIVIIWETTNKISNIVKRITRGLKCYTQKPLFNTKEYMNKRGISLRKQRAK